MRKSVGTNVRDLSELGNQIADDEFHAYKADGVIERQGAGIRGSKYELRSKFVFTLPTHMVEQGTETNGMNWEEEQPRTCEV